MAEQHFAFALREPFQMPWGEGPEVVFVVVDRMHTDRGNMYWLQTKDRPKHTHLFVEAYLWKRRMLEALRAGRPTESLTA